MNPTVLGPDEATARLSSVGVRLPRSVIAATADGVAAAFTSLGAATVVLKAAGLVHKTDADGVVLGLTDADSAAAAAAAIESRLGEAARPFLLQEQVRGTEILVGLRREHELGAVLVVGQGGVAAEVMGDVSRRLVPVDREDARAMLRELRIWPLLEGHRGRAGVDVEALLDVMVAVARLAVDDHTIMELDLNPVLVGAPGEGAVCVDVRVVVDEVPAPRLRSGGDLERMMRPQHVVAVGVSDDEHKVGARLFRYLVDHGFTGRLDPVHPSGGEIRGHTRYASLSDVEGSPDLVCIAVPAGAVAPIARECVARGVGGVIVHSSDFAEVGPEGRAKQDELLDILAPAGIPLAGPNDMGIVSPHQQLTASISGGLEGVLVPGSLGLVTSSGALGSCLATRLMGAGIGLSRWIHVGNEADLVIADYLDWLADDPETTAVGLLLEDLKDGARFVAAGRRLAAAGKPVFAYDMIRSDEGREAALSHTGAMVGSLALRQEVLRAAQMVSVPSLRVLEDALTLAATADLPKGRRLMAVTFSGGACSIIADEALATGISMPPLTPATRDEVAQHVPSFAAVRNPLDVSYQMLSEPERFGRALSTLLAQGEFDALLVQFTTNADPYAEHVARATIAVRDRAQVPVYVSRYGATHLAPKALAAYREAGVIVMDAPDRAVQAIAAVMPRTSTI
jgi:acyl-CoA synthetase (NDP forming)